VKVEMKPEKRIELLVATTNMGKLEEIRKMFDQSSVSIKLYSLKDFDIDVDCIEDGDTFAANAQKKSLFYNNMVPADVYTVGDDSGLSVEALNGAPGVFSARYSGHGATDDKNTAKLLMELKEIENRNAKFITTACLSKNGQLVATFTGEVKGVIIDKKRGSMGFGYDPVFYYPPLEKTFAELTTEQKNQISHRAQAFQKLKEFFASDGQGLF
jgi:XTP/dITP diphosphohydrolase